MTLPARPVLHEVTTAPESLALLGRFYRQTYTAEFPHPDERESLENMEEYLRKKAQGWYGRNNYHVLLLLDEGAPVAGSIIDYLEEPATGVIEFLVVDPRSRGQGLGRRLLLMTEDALREDARRAGAEICAIVAEMNDPFRLTPHPDNLDPFVRASIWHSWGYGRIDFPYVQPALSEDQEPVQNLLLMAKLFEGAGKSARRRALSAAQVKLAVHEYIRWAMRIEAPADNAEFGSMARFLDERQRQGRAIEVEPLGEYVGLPDLLPFRVHEVRAEDDAALAAALAVYERSFESRPTVLDRDVFRAILQSRCHEETGGRYHLWAFESPVTPAVLGMTSFFTFPGIGFGGYLAFCQALRNRGALLPAIRCIERAMMEDKLGAEGWFIECEADSKSAVGAERFRRTGFRELDLDYIQPPLPGAARIADGDVRLVLLFKRFGADHGLPPTLGKEDFLRHMEWIFKVVYRMPSPLRSPFFERLKQQIAAWPGTSVRWR